MQTFVKLQPSSVTDHITEDGHELQQRPYPLSFFLDGTIVDPDDFWKPDTFGIIGFTSDPSVSRINVWWYRLRDEFKLSADPKVFDQLVGMYMVTTEDPDVADVCDRSPRWSTHYIAIESVEVFYNPAPFPTTTRSAA